MPLGLFYSGGLLLVAIGVIVARMARWRTAAALAAIASVAALLSVFTPWEEDQAERVVGFRASAWVTIAARDGTTPGFHGLWVVGLAACSVVLCTAFAVRRTPALPAGSARWALVILAASVTALALAGFDLARRGGLRSSFRGAAPEPLETVAGVGIHLTILAALTASFAALGFYLRCREAGRRRTSCPKRRPNMATSAGPRAT